MIPFDKPLYITCKKCKHQSDIPQTGDLLLGHWECCPKCECEEWELAQRQFIKKLSDYFHFSKHLK